jgi:hypothetical protein
MIIKFKEERSEKKSGGGGGREMESHHELEHFSLLQSAKMNRLASKVSFSSLLWHQAKRET